MFQTKSECIERLIKFIGKLKNSIKIESGELNRDIYSDTQIAQAFRNIVDKITIEVQSAPVICVDEETKKNIIIGLWREGQVKLYLRKVRGDKIHRWIGDGHFIYSEDFHPPLADIQTRKVIVLSEEQEQFWASKANEAFDSRIKDKEVEEASPESLLLLTPSAIKKIYTYFSDRGEDYNYKTKDEINKVREQFGIEAVPLS